VASKHNSVCIKSSLINTHNMCNIYLHEILYVLFIIFFFCGKFRILYFWALMKNVLSLVDLVSAHIVYNIVTCLDFVEHKRLYYNNICTSNRDRKIKYNLWPGHCQNDLSYTADKANIAGKLTNYFIQQYYFINYIYRGRIICYAIWAII